MKDIPKKFVKNCDGVGDNTFIQVKKEGNVYMYRRERMDGTVKSYEVFLSKFIAKGTPLPNGAVEKEDRMQYPGSALFGKSAYDCKTEDQAETRFEQLVKKSKDSEDAKEEAVRTGKPNKGRRKAKAKPSIDVPKGKFNMKFLIEATGYTQPELYPIVKNWLTNNKILVVGKKKAEGGKGRSAFVYEAVV
jgi:hypothetical protein